MGLHPNAAGTRIGPVTGYPTPKLVLDKALSTVLLVLLSPVFALLIVAIGLNGLLRRRDRGPWLYRERRISRGRPFDLLKFRTLQREVLERVGDQESHVRLLEADDANLTWAGRRVLKPWYLDELPQIWNVLRGDMSLVGPRPWPPSMVASQVAKGLTYRNEFVAGWTGPAQVQKGMTETARYDDLDVAYVEETRCANAWQIVRRDLGLLRRTVSVLSRGEGLEY
jgi:lipopolysaccharide/colanic/teichoic acid biosynthesis glycosyltransferase